MKKTLIALAVLATAGTAFAQSTVSLTGLVGAAAQSFDSRGGFRQRGIALTDATIAVSVTEDLGSGLKAAAGIQFDESLEQFGKPLNRRNTFASLTGGFGQLRFDNTRSSNLLAKGMVAPANLYYNIYDSGVIGRAPVDALTYGMAFGDFTGSVQYVESSITSVQGDGVVNATTKAGVLNAGYAKGPIAAGVAYKAYSFRTPGVQAASKRDYRLEAFATYDLGVAKFGVGYDGPNVGKTAATETAVDRAAAWSVGVSAPLGAVTVGANYAKRDVNKVTELVAKYDLSKRTSLNASLGRQTYNTGTDSGNQYRIGAYHSF